MGGEFGGALGEEDTELAGGAAEEADQHGGPPRAEQQLGRRRAASGEGPPRRRTGRGGRWSLRRWMSAWMSAPGASMEGGMVRSVDMESFGTWVCAVVYSVDGLHL